MQNALNKVRNDEPSIKTTENYYSIEFKATINLNVQQQRVTEL
jgi:hypothetical protein